MWYIAIFAALAVLAVFAFFVLKGRERDEVHDGLGALGSAAQALRVGHVPLDDFAAPRLQASLFLGASRDHSDGQLLRAQRMDHVPAHEAGSPDDEDGHSKLRQ